MTYDNTDERGEDAVARQRGGSERPQHVDTCRVYNCYGCEEIVDESRVADDLTRQSDDYTTGYAMGQADMRKYLLADDTHSYTYGYRAALDAARDAVAALLITAMDWDYKSSSSYGDIRDEARRDALAAIDALRATP